MCDGAGKRFLNALRTVHEEKHGDPQCTAHSADGGEAGDGGFGCAAYSSWERPRAAQKPRCVMGFLNALHA